MTCTYVAPMIALTRTLARIRYTGDRSGFRPSDVNPALTSSRATSQSARPGAYSPPAPS
jgi:hypothetical protein